MRSTATVVACLIAAALAGCIAADGSSLDDEQPAHQESTQMPPERLELVGCDEQFAVFTTPASQAEAYLPDGFALVGVNGDPVTNGAAPLVILTLECQEPETDETVTQFWVHLVVDPPDVYARADAALHYVPVMWPVASEAFLDVLHAWGIPQATEAEILLDAGSSSPGVASWQTDVSEQGASAVLSTKTAGNHPPTGGGVVRIFGVEDGEVTGAVDFEGTAWEGAAGLGTFDNDGFVPLEVQGPGAGGLALDYGYVVKPGELPEGV